MVLSICWIEVAKGSYSEIKHLRGRKEKLCDVRLGLLAGINLFEALFLLLKLPGGCGAWRFASTLRSRAGGRAPLSLGGNRSLRGFRLRRGLRVGVAGVRNSGQGSEILLLEGFKLNIQKQSL